eukprot:g64867.t1
MGGGPKKGGLAFLNKKTWHTGHIRNIEKVWIAEQKEANEQRKLAEIQRQLDEERDAESLKQLQADHGLISSQEKNRVDWMYTGSGGMGPSAEEYLLGAEYKAPKEDTSEVRKMEDGGVGSKLLSGGITAKLDAEAKLREDPMMAIMQAERSKRKDVLNNPLKMKDIKNASNA